VRASTCSLAPPCCAMPARSTRCVSCPPSEERWQVCLQCLHPAHN
jgi:hypothetical protein